MPRETKVEREAREEQERVDALSQQSESDASAAVSGDDDGENLVVKGVVDGPVVLTRAGVEIASFTAEGGKITAKDVDERDLLLASVPGAHL